MKIEQVGLQLFTLREHLKTSADLLPTLTKVRDIGYQTVQVSGISAEITPTQIRDACDQAGLKIVAAHHPAKRLFEEPDAVIEELKIFGTDLTAYPFPGDVDFNSEAVVSELIAQLTKAGKALADAGMTLMYHNHSIEFMKLNGEIILERIYREIDPAYLQGEPDTYWIQYGGGDNLRWCERLHNRLPLMHLKDYKVVANKEVDLCEIGAGNLDFRAIIAAADKAGCKWYCVEQDRCPGDPFDSVKQSFDYIAANLCS